MGRRYRQIAFTEAVKAVQERLDSRRTYARGEQPDARAPDALGPDEVEFIEVRDSFYMATVGESGWPYVQHRGGPPGFVRVLDEHTIAFPDYRGNRQYVSVGNLAGDDRVSLIFMDYPNRRRLKLFGHARIGDASAGEKVERTMIIAVEGFDWNCPQYITPRFTLAELERIRESIDTDASP